MFEFIPAVTSLLTPLQQSMPWCRMTFTGAITFSVCIFVHLLNIWAYLRFCTVFKIFELFHLLPHHGDDDIIWHHYGHLWTDYVYSMIPSVATVFVFGRAMCVHEFASVCWAPAATWLCWYLNNCWTWEKLNSNTLMLFKTGCQWPVMEFFDRHWKDISVWLYSWATWDFYDSKNAYPLLWHASRKAWT